MAYIYLFEDDGPREVPCPRCFVDAGWRFLDETKTQVEVTCPDCGRFQMPRIEFQEIETNAAAFDERT